MSMKCRLCGRGLNQIGGYLQRVNEKGVAGVWECRPTCEADLIEETAVLLAVEGEEVDELRGEVKP